MKCKSLLIVVTAVFLCPHAAWPHGYAGDRYFPATIEIDDPFAADEVHAIVGKRPSGGGPVSPHSSIYTLGGGVEPVDGFGLSLDAAYRAPNSGISPIRNGFDNLVLTVKKELVINAAHEYAISVGLVSQLGGTGTSRATNRLAYAPTLYYAKGFGDLPESMKWMRPFAVTGVFARETSSNSVQPAMLNWGFTIQYSLPYLQAHVKDVGLREPFSKLIPVVEFPVRTCLSSGCSGQTTRTINPGVVWVGPINLSAQAVIPINARSGHGTGVLFQFQKYLSQ